MKKLISVFLAALSVMTFILIPAGAEDRTVTDIWITKMPDKTEYCVGEKIDLTGMELGVAYSDGTQETVTEGMECNAVFDRKGTTMVTVTYMGEPENFYVTVDYNLAQKIVSVIEYLISFFYISFKNIIAWF